MDIEIYISMQLMQIKQRVCRSTPTLLHLILIFERPIQDALYMLANFAWFVNYELLQTSVVHNP